MERMSKDTKQACIYFICAILFIIAWSYASSVDLEIINLQNK